MARVLVCGTRDSARQRGAMEMMMRRLAILTAAFALVVCGGVFAQDQQPPAQIVVPAPVVNVQAPNVQVAAPARVTAPVGAIASQPQPDGSIVYLYPLIHDLEPYVITAVVGVIGSIGAILSGFVLWWLKAKFGYDADQATRDKMTAAIKSFQDYAARQANIWIAGKEPGWENLKIDVGNPFIAQAAAVGMDRLPEAAASAGMTPEKLSEWIVAEIGKAQKSVLPPVGVQPGAAHV